MKVNDRTRFPHPVLSDLTGDYKEGHFAFVVTEVEEVPKQNKVTLHYEIEISEESIAELIEAGKAEIGIFVTCLETYYNDLKAIDPTNSSISFEPGTLNGRVIVRPVIWVSEDVEDFSSSNLHEEFGGDSLKLSKSEVIALGEETIFTVGREKLAPMETIFSLAKDDTVPPGEIMVQTEADKITILACPETYTHIYRLRGNTPGKVILLNSVYLPAVMEVLSALQNPPEALIEQRWYRIFRAKCEHIGINPESGDVLSDAQKLLKSPFSRIEKSREISAA